MNATTFDKIKQAENEPDDFVLQIIYQRGDGVTTRRYVSPVSGHTKSSIALKAMCLSDEELPVKFFRIDRIAEMVVYDANQIQIPTEERIIGS